MSESIQVSITLPVEPEAVYNAWLNSDEHSQFTGSLAEINPQVGGIFSAWDGYIKGVTIELSPYSRIIQSWRADDFPPEAIDSRLEVIFEKVNGGTKLTLIHTDVPDGQGKEFEQGWFDFYFTPMQAFFSKKPE